MMILRNIIITNVYFIVARVYSIESSDNVNISNYTVNMYLYKTSGNDTLYTSYMNVILDNNNNIDIEVPANLLILIQIQSNKLIYIKELIIEFDKINILSNQIMNTWDLGKHNVSCHKEHRIKRFQYYTYIYIYIYIYIYFSY